MANNAAPANEGARAADRDARLRGDVSVTVDVPAEQMAEPAWTRLWFVVYVAWLTLLTLLAQHAFGQYEHGDAGALRRWLLALMAIYLSLCNATLPLPTAWIIFAIASDTVMEGVPAVVRVAVVALVGGVATMMANLNEYHILAFLSRYGFVRRFRRTRAVQWAIRWFDVAPFQTLTLISLVPIPVDVVRWLAILRRYPRVRFAAAYFAGRSLRYALFATLAVILSLKPRQIILIQAALVLLVGARFAYSAWRAARAPGQAPPAQRPASGRGAQMTQ